MNDRLTIPEAIRQEVLLLSMRHRTIGAVVNFLVIVGLFLAVFLEWSGWTAAVNGWLAWLQRWGYDPWRCEP